MPIKGIINFSHLSYVTSTIAREAKINPAGVIKEISPSPYAYAETIAALDTPTVSASGAMIGTDNTASPEEDEMKNPSTINTNIIRIIKMIGFIPLMAPEKYARIVSETIPFSSMIFELKRK